MAGSRWAKKQKRDILSDEMRLNYNQEKVVGIISLLKPKEAKEEECEETCEKVIVCTLGCTRYTRCTRYVQ